MSRLGGRLRKSKRYGVDLDGVCFDFVSPFSGWLKQKLSIDYHDHEIVDYHWYNCIPGLSEKDFWNEFHKWGQSGNYKTLELLPGAKDGVRWLLENAGDVYFITARPEYALDQTLECLSEHFEFDKNKLIFANGCNGKVKEVNELGVDIMIEDAPHNAKEIVEKTAADIYLMDTSYNRDVKHDRIVRVKHWNEILTRERGK